MTIISGSARREGEYCFLLPFLIELPEVSDHGNNHRGSMLIMAPLR